MIFCKRNVTKHPPTVFFEDKNPLDILSTTYEPNCLKHFWIVLDGYEQERDGEQAFAILKNGNLIFRMNNAKIELKEYFKSQNGEMTNLKYKNDSLDFSVFITPEKKCRIFASLCYSGSMILHYKGNSYTEEIKGCETLSK
jgi:hypothetical protein